jgi:hypothetical protein
MKALVTSPPSNRTDCTDSPTFSVRRRISDSDIVPNIVPPFLLKF